MKTDANKPKKKTKKKFFRYLALLLFIVSLLTLGVIFYLNVIPTNYFILLSVLFLTFDFFMLYLLIGHGWKKRLFGTILSFLKMILMAFLLFYLLNTLDFLNKIKGGNYNTENYSVIVLKNSQYEKLKDLKNKTVAVLNLGEDKGIEEAKKHLDKKEDFTYQEVDDISNLLPVLEKKQVDAILVENAEKSILSEDNLKFSQMEKVIYEFSIDVKIEDELVKDVKNITNTPFNLFISGVDSYGKISSVSRSDVNMVVTVNPNKHQILFTSIPRDYYVPLYGIRTAFKDKITHAGIHGIDTSVKTVEKLLETDINYYAKVNFTSLVDLVDEIGGIDVLLDKPFRAYYIDDNDKVVNYSFKKGKNHLNGKQALAFARERKSLGLGDVARAEHQQLLLEAIINKALKSSIITKYNDLLDVLEGKFVTNLGTQNITKLVKYQLKENPSWEIKKNTLTGTNSSNYTYTYKSTKSYVMEPDLESLENGKNLIRSVLE